MLYIPEKSGKEDPLAWESSENTSSLKQTSEDALGMQVKHMATLFPSRVFSEAVV